MLARFPLFRAKDENPVRVDATVCAPVIHLHDSSRPPSPHLTNGTADWQEFAFNSLAVETATRRGEALVLTLSAIDPATALRGLEK